MDDKTKLKIWSWILGITILFTILHITGILFKIGLTVSILWIFEIFIKKKRNLCLKIVIL